MTLKLNVKCAGENVSLELNIALKLVDNPTETDKLLECETKLSQNIIYKNLSPTRKAVLLDMCFSLGYIGLMKLKKMWFALGNKDYPQASREIKDSLYYQEFAESGKRNVEIMASNLIVKKD